MSLKQTDEWVEARELWLAEHGRTEGDVMWEAEGEYVMVDGEDGYEKVQLPANIQQRDEI